MSDPDAPWDPDPLKIGDRVMVRKSGECPLCAESMLDTASWDGPATIVPCPFGDGSVLRTPGKERYRHRHAPGHDYTAEYDRPRWSERYGDIVGVCVSRAELERM